MDRRQFVASGLALAVTGALARPARAAAETEAAKARALYDRIFEEILLVAPQPATTLGLDTGPRAGAGSLLNGRGRAHRLGPLGPLAKAWPAVQKIDASQFVGADRRISRRSRGSPRSAASSRRSRWARWIPKTTRCLTW